MGLYPNGAAGVAEDATAETAVVFAGEEPKVDVTGSAVGRGLVRLPTRIEHKVLEHILGFSSQCEFLRFMDQLQSSLRQGAAVVTAKPG